MTTEKIDEYLAKGLLTRSEAIKLLAKQVDNDIKLEKDIHSFLFSQGAKSWK